MDLSMWVCAGCECQGVAADLAACPQCGQLREPQDAAPADTPAKAPAKAKAAVT